MAVKNFIRILIASILLAFLFITFNQNNKINNLNSEIQNKTSVIKSYEEENDSLTNIAIVQNRTISELNISKDSINRKLIEKINELKIKENKIKELEYIKQLASKKDSIFIRDTIFVNNFTLDTIITDEWYRLHMTMMFPNLVVINPEFKSELNIVKYYNKEYLGEPKKYWISRLFQKKILVERVNIIENSPYITTTNYRDIEIINK